MPAAVDESADLPLRVHSRETISIPMDRLMVNGTLEVFPEVESKGYFSFHFAGKELRLLAGPYIGLIPINHQITIDVRPRLPVANLARVIQRAQHPIASLQGAQRLYKGSEEHTSSILEFLAQNLVEAARPLLLNGLIQEYGARKRNSSQPRGRVDVHATVFRNYARGVRHLVYTGYFERGLDNPFNRVIKAAVWQTVTRLRRVKGSDRRLITELNALMRRFERVSRLVSDVQIKNVEGDVWKGGLPANRRYYERLLQIALVILQHGSISLVEHGRDVQLTSFILNFEELFEAYIRQVLREGSWRLGRRVSVKDGNKEGRKPLFDNVKEPPAQPDIVLTTRNGSGVFVVEVKYKRSINRADLNQALVYGASYRAKCVVLVYPETREDGLGLRPVGKLGHLSLFAYGFDLNDVDVDRAETRLCDAVFALTRAG